MKNTATNFVKTEQNMLQNRIKITNQTLHHVHIRVYHNTRNSIQNKAYMKMKVINSRFLNRPSPYTQKSVPHRFLNGH